MNPTGKPQNLNSEGWDPDLDGTQTLPSIQMLAFAALLRVGPEDVAIEKCRDYGKKGRGHV